MPGVKNVGDVVPGQTLKILRLQPRPIAQFQGVRPVFWQLAEKPIKVGDKITAMGIIGRPKAGELEHEHADLGPDGLARSEKAGDEKAGVEVLLVWLARKGGETFEVRKFFNRDGVSNLEGKLKIIRDLSSQVLQVFLRGKRVVSGIDADGLEDLGIFGEAIAVEAGLSELAAVFVTRGVIKRAAPARVFPRGSPDKNAFGSELRRLSFYFFSVELHLKLVLTSDYFREAIALR